MRTTLNIDDDVLAVARALAEREGISIGNALSGLMRRGIKSRPSVEDEKSPPGFAVFPDAEPITSEDIHRALSDWP